MNKNIFKLLRSLTCIGGGIISIIAKNNVIFIGFYPSHEYYGGDAYTGIQNAAADAAHSANNVGNIIEDGLGFFFLLAAVLLIAFGLIGLIEAVVSLKHSSKTKSVLPGNVQPEAAVEFENKAEENTEP